VNIAQAVYGFPNYPSLNPCVTTAVYYGNVRDYKVNIGEAVLRRLGHVPALKCGYHFHRHHKTVVILLQARLFNVGETIPFTGVTYQWQSSSSPTSGFANISGATGMGYVQAVVTPGTVYYKQLVTCATTGFTSSTPVQGITMNVSPNPITGATSICNGASTTLGYYFYRWFMDQQRSGCCLPLVQVTGVVTGVSVGSATINIYFPIGLFLLRHLWLLIRNLRLLQAQA